VQKDKELLRIKCWLLEGKNYDRKRTHMVYTPNDAELIPDLLEATVLTVLAPDKSELFPDDLLDEIERAAPIAAPFAEAPIADAPIAEPAVVVAASRASSSSSSSNSSTSSSSSSSSTSSSSSS
jgi:hypothetical protein